SGIALFNNEIAPLKLNPLELFDHSTQRQRWQSPEIAEFVEETLQRVRSPRHLHVVFQIRSLFGQGEEVGSIESQHFDRGAATNSRRACPPFPNRGVTEAVSRATRV